MTRTCAALLVAGGFFAAADASAQTGVPAAVSPPAPIGTRVFVDAGSDKLAASRSFNAIFGTDRGPVFGGGGEVILFSNWFVRGGAWRFHDRGERAVRFENRTFRLGIPLSVTIVPIEVSGGYRFPLDRRRLLMAYAGAGLGTHSYKETSDFAQGDEHISERFTGYQVLGGVEYRLHRFIGVAGEVQYTTVPDAIGAGGLSAEFNESDLGGLIVRARVLFGR